MKKLFDTWRRNGHSILPHSKLLALALMLLPFSNALSQTDDAISVTGPMNVVAGMTYTVSVQYSASQQRDVAVYLFNTSVWNTWGSARTTVSAGSGTVNLTVTVTNPAVGGNYQWTGKVETVGGSQSLDEATQWCQVVTAPATNITIDANFGSATGKSIKKRAFGLNLFRGFDPNVAGTPGNSTYKSNLAAMQPAHVRYHSWEMIGSGNNSWVKANGDWDATRINNALQTANSWNPEVLINIPWFPSSKNWGDAAGKLKTANYADFANWCAELVRIVNIQQGRNVKYWEVTNERDDLYYGSCTELGNIFNQAAAAMKAVDPTIKVGGPAFAKPFAEHVQNIHDFMEATKNTVDFISYHNYPTNQNLTNQQVFDNTWGWITNFMRETWASHSTRTIEFHHNEYNISYNPPMTAMNNEAGMVFDALMLVSMLENGVDVADAWNEADGWYGKLDGSFNRRPASYLYENFNKNYTEAPIYSSTTSDGTKIIELASKNGNKVQLLLINRAESDQVVKFNFTGLGTLNSSTAVTITESVKAGGLVTKSTTIGAITTGSGYLSEAFAVSLLTFETGGTTNNPPSVNITSPSTGATFTAPANITISANASDSDGSITKVEFYSGSTKLGEDTSSPFNFIWNNVSAGSYTITAKATDNSGAATTSTGISITVNAPIANGQVIREYWTGISGTAVSAIPVATSPTGTSILTSLECPANWADNYGTRIRGYIVPTTTGSYTFYIASDDNSELWLSTNDLPANKVKIASVTSWTNNKEWTKYTSQKSTAKSLTAGQKYYFEALQKEGSGGDNLAIGWTGPGISTISVIGSTNISSYTQSTVPVTSVSVSPASATLTAGATQQLTATVLPSNATNKTVSWSSSNASVATVNSSGLVTAIAAGSATITVTTQDGNKTATSIITVNAPTSAVYNIYTESGTNDFANDGGTVASYAITITTVTSGAPEGSQYRSLVTNNHYASYRFEYASAGINKSSWNTATLELSIKTTSDFEIYMEDASGGSKYLSLSNYISKSGNWENAQIPISAFSGVNLSTLRRIGFYKLWQTSDALNIDNVRVTGTGAKSSTVEELQENQFQGIAGISAYPNPVERGSEIYLKAEGFEKQTELTIFLCDISGKTLRVYPVLSDDCGSIMKTISTESLENGLYTLQVRSTSDIRHSKIIIR